MSTTEDTDNRGDDQSSPHEESTLLPADFDRLVPAEELAHGQYNPRRTSPSDALRRSVANHGLEHPLIVHKPEDDDVYHITDGWQRYQAALNAGWAQLPVRVHETALAALQSAERESLGEAYSTYTWACFCRSVAAKVEGDSAREQARQVTTYVDNAPSVQTVTRYLRVLSLPSEIHPLLTDGPNGTEGDWQALRNYNPDVKRYDGLSWVVAEKLSKHRTSVSDQRLIGIAANAVAFDKRKRAKEFVKRAAENTEVPPETVVEQMQLNNQSDGTVIVPRVVVSLSPEEKQALLTHLHQTRTPFQSFIEEQVRDLVGKATDEWKN